MVEHWVRCVQPFVDAEEDERRAVGDEWVAGSLARAAGLHKGGLVVRIDGPEGGILDAPGGWPWGTAQPDRHLETAREYPGEWDRVVACLNIWNDLEALRATYESWYPHVDHVLAVDGAYAGAPADVCRSTDGTVEFLRGLEKVELVEAPRDSFWAHQPAKRNQYMKRARAGDLLFVVDADEVVSGAESLRDLPALEVGWVPYKKDIYRKVQNFPRLFDAHIRPRYEGRHYWIFGRRPGSREPGREFVTDCQVGGPGFDHRFVPLEIDNETHRKEARTDERLRARRTIATVQASRESRVGEDGPGGRESLRIVQINPIDPGMVVFRLHAAINSTTPHESVQAGRAPREPYLPPQQLCLQRNRNLIRQLLEECDLIHLHLGYHPLDQLGVAVSCPVVIHHHGTMYRDAPDRRNQQDARRADVRLVSNPELLQYDEGMHYLPNPVPVRRYARMREREYRPEEGVFRVGHSPSKRWLKGTDEFLGACSNLRARGVPIRPVLIEDCTHAESVRRKAEECDAFFDSFWLGMQCSGIEAAAMDMPVVAGDEHVRAFHGGETPYTYANDRSSLEAALERLWADREYRGAETRRVVEYVREHHDYAAVTSRYVDILDEELDWRRKLSLSGDRFLRR